MDIYTYITVNFRLFYPSVFAHVTPFPPQTLAGASCSGESCAQVKSWPCTAESVGRDRGSKTTLTDYGLSGQVLDVEEKTQKPQEAGAEASSGARRSKVVRGCHL